VPLLFAGVARAAGQATIAVGAAHGAPGTTVTIAVSLITEGLPIVATQNEIQYDPHTVVQARSNGAPDCRVNPDINKDDSRFQFRPPGCAAGECRGVEAFVFGFNFDTIPDGVLYTCRIGIAAGALGPYTLANVGVRASDAQGGLLPVVGTNGVVLVAPLQSPTPTLTPSRTPSPTITPTPAPCAGDCGRDGHVTVDDLVTGVSIALGNLPLTVCGTFDTNDDLQVTVDELVDGVNKALNGC
jgi:hypothetical protein